MATGHQDLASTVVGGSQQPSNTQLSAEERKQLPGQISGNLRGLETFRTRLDTFIKNEQEILKGNQKLLSESSETLASMHLDFGKRKMLQDSIDHQTKFIDFLREQQTSLDTNLEASRSLMAKNPRLALSALAQAKNGTDSLGKSLTQIEEIRDSGRDAMHKLFGAGAFIPFPPVSFPSAILESATKKEGMSGWDSLPILATVIPLPGLGAGAKVALRVGEEVVIREGAQVAERELAQSAAKGGARVMAHDIPHAIASGANQWTGNVAASRQWVFTATEETRVAIQWAEREGFDVATDFASRKELMAFFRQLGGGLKK